MEAANVGVEVMRDRGVRVEGSVGVGIARYASRGRGME